MKNNLIYNLEMLKMKIDLKKIDVCLTFQLAWQGVISMEKQN
jgi:hypothetical protein